MLQQYFFRMEMNPEESLDIIARMMSQTRRSVLADVYFPFLAWGWPTIGICVAVYLGLVLTGDFVWNYVWLLLPLFGLGGLALRHKKEPRVNTELMISLLRIWRMLALVLAGFSLTAYIVSFNVLFFVLLMLAIGSYVTGAVIKYSVLRYAAMAGLVIAPVMWFVEGPKQLLLFAVAILGMMIFPAYKIKQDLKNERA